MTGHYKHPRVYVDQPLGTGKTAILGEGQAHYLKNVLRREAGDALRLFNARDGEWLARLVTLDKKSAAAECGGQLRPPGTPGRRLHLLFPPLAKDRMDFLIEKAVELGVSDLHPITTRQSDIRKINEARIAAQIIEAAEQCERPDVPVLHSLISLQDILRSWDSSVPVFAALERTDATPIQPYKKDCAILIGPPGGFSDEEKNFLSRHACVRPVTLTKNILRSETAALFALAIMAE